MAPPGRHQATWYPLVKISLWVGADDWRWLQTQCPNDASRVIRDFLLTLRKESEERDAQRAQPLDLSQL